MGLSARATAGLSVALWLSLLAPAWPDGLQAAETKTSKERLWDKGSDEQRLDNCGVPAERRGTKPRPGCPTVETAAAPEPAAPPEQPAAPDAPAETR